MSPNVGSDLRKPHVLPVYIYDQRQHSLFMTSDEEIKAFFVTTG